MKLRWFLETLEEFGNCGKILYVDDRPLGFACYAFAQRFPKAQEYRSKKLGKAGEGVVFLSCLYIDEDSFRGKGLGGCILNEVVAELKGHGFKAIETFARRDSSNNPSGPVRFYVRRGFRIKEELDFNFTLVRQDL